MSVEYAAEEFPLYDDRSSEFELRDPQPLFGNHEVDQAFKQTDVLAKGTGARLRAAEAWATAAELRPLKEDWQAAERELNDLREQAAVQELPANRPSVELNKYHDVKETINLLNEVQKTVKNPEAELSEYEVNSEQFAALGLHGQEIDTLKQELMEAVTDLDTSSEILRSLLIQLKNRPLRHQLLDLLNARDQQDQEDVDLKEALADERVALSTIEADLGQGAQMIESLKTRLPDKEQAALYHDWLKQAQQELKQAFNPADSQPAEFIKKIAALPEGFFPLPIITEQLGRSINELTRRASFDLTPESSATEVATDFNAIVARGLGPNEQRLVLHSLQNVEQQAQDAGRRQAAIEERLVSEQAAREPYDRLTEQVLSRHPEAKIGALFDVKRNEPVRVRQALSKVLQYPEGATLLQENPELFSAFSPYEQAHLFLKTNPEEALRLAREAAAQDRASGQRQMKDQRYALIEELCVHTPNAIPLLRNEHLSETDEKSLVMRVYRKNIPAAMKLVEELEIVFSPDEQESIMDQALDELKRVNTVVQNMTEASEIEVILDDARTNTQNWSHIFAWKQPDIVAFFQRYPEDEQELLRRLGFRIPTKIKAVSWREAEKVVKPRDRDDAREAAEDALIDRTSALEDQLTASLIEMAPQRAAEFQRQNDREKRLHGQIESVGALGGMSATAPLFLELKGEELPVVYKPQLREPIFVKLYPGPDDPFPTHRADPRRTYREGIRPREGVYREWLVGQIDKVFQLGLVPTTILRQGPEGFGSVQEWKIGQDAFDIPNWKEAFPLEERMKLAILDIMSLNCDRYRANFLLTPEKKAVAIDNGYSLSTRSDLQDDRIMSFPLDSVKGMPIPPAMQDQIRRTRANMKLMSALKEGFILALREDGERLWEEFQQRLEMIAPSDPRVKAVFPASDWLYLNQ